MKNKLIIILSILLLAGCVVPRNYSRAKEKVDRIVNKFPEILENDTIVITDSIIIPEVKTDTITKINENDTIIINKERLKIKIIRLPGDTFKIEGECKTDTIYKKIAVPVYSIDKHNLIKKQFLGLGLWSWILILIIIILLIYTFLIRK